VVECKAGMLVVAGSMLGRVKFFLVDVIENLSLHSKELELGQRSKELGRKFKNMLSIMPALISK